MHFKGPGDKDQSSRYTSYILWIWHHPAQWHLHAAILKALAEMGNKVSHLWKPWTIARYYLGIIRLPGHGMNDSRDSGMPVRDIGSVYYSVRIHKTNSEFPAAFHHPPSVAKIRASPLLLQRANEDCTGLRATFTSWPCIMQTREMGNGIETQKVGLGVDSQVKIIVGEFDRDLCPQHFPSKNIAVWHNKPKEFLWKSSRCDVGASLQNITRFQVPQLDSKEL